MDINSTIDTIMRYTCSRVNLPINTYQELVAKANNQNYEIDKKTSELMRKDLETINQLKQEVEYWKSLYNEAIEENRKQTKKSHWFD